MELCIQMTIIMTGKELFNAFKEMAVPFFKNYWYNRRSKHFTGKLTAASDINQQVFHDYNLEEFTSATMIEEYITLGN